MKNEKLRVLIINDMVIFPNNEVRIEYDKNFDKQMSETFECNDDYILIVNPIDEDSDIDITSLPNYGVLGKIKLKINVPNGKTRVVIEGLERVEVVNYTFESKNYTAIYKALNLPAIPNEKNYINVLIKTLEHYIEKVPYIGNAIMGQISNINNLDELCDLMASFLNIDYQRKKKYITSPSPIDRCKYLIEDINEEIQFVELEQKIESEVEKELNETQKEYFLREKIKAMQKELGESNSKDDEVVRLKKKISKLKCNSKVKEKITRELARYEAINSNSPELGTIRDYLDWMLNLPWNKYTKDNEDLAKVKSILDSSHYALEEVKERILEYLAVKQNTNNSRSPIICLVGPPGVGKTSLAISIANSLNRKVAKISVGGINDEAEIIGHRRTYI